MKDFAEQPNAPVIIGDPHSELESASYVIIPYLQYMDLHRTVSRAQRMLQEDMENYTKLNPRRRDIVIKTLRIVLGMER